MRSSSIKTAIYGMTFLAYFVPFLAWAGMSNWKLGDTTLLMLFPLLGLWAFAQMWVHYAVAPIKRRHPDAFDYKKWYHNTSIAVLVLILLHPAILAFETVSIGLTPFDYVSSDDYFFLAIAYFALGCFLLYEFAERLTNSKFWQKHFGQIVVLNFIAMFAIFVHSFWLGKTVDGTWLKFVWSLMFFAFLGFTYDWLMHRKKSK
jgi:hypothetical protein